MSVIAIAMSKRNERRTSLRPCAVFYPSPALRQSALDKFYEIVYHFPRSSGPARPEE